MCFAYLLPLLSLWNSWPISGDIIHYGINVTTLVVNWFIQKIYWGMHESDERIVLATWLYCKLLHPPAITRIWYDWRWSYSLSVEGSSEGWCYLELCRLQNSRTGNWSAEGGGSVGGKWIQRSREGGGAVQMMHVELLCKAFWTAVAVQRVWDSRQSGVSVGDRTLIGGLDCWNGDFIVLTWDCCSANIRITQHVCSRKQVIHIIRIDDRELDAVIHWRGEWPLRVHKCSFVSGSGCRHVAIVRLSQIARGTEQIWWSCWHSFLDFGWECLLDVGWECHSTLNWVLTCAESQILSKKNWSS